MQVKAFGPGLEPTGVIVNKSTQFTVDARQAGKGSLKIYAQVCPCRIVSMFAFGNDGSLSLNISPVSRTSFTG